MGTGEFAVLPLTALVNSRHEISAVVSQPDKPRGRGLKETPTPVKRAALVNELPVWQPETLRGTEARETLAAYQPDIVVVAAYGKILPAWVWEDPPLSAINIHGSVLPAYRGAAPVQRAVINGETETGITILKVATEVDTGDVLLSRKLSIEADETAGELFARLSKTGATAILEALDLIESGRAVWQKQLNDEGTYAPKITKEEARLDWARDALSLKNLIRGLNPNPGAYFTHRGKRIKVWRGAALPYDGREKPGTFVEPLAGGPVIVCGKGALALTEVQPEGKVRLTGAEFLRGYRPDPGEAVE